MADMFSQYGGREDKRTTSPELGLVPEKEG